MVFSNETHREWKYYSLLCLQIILKIQIIVDTRECGEVEECQHLPHWNSNWPGCVI